MEELHRFGVWTVACESNSDKGFLRQALRYEFYARTYHETQNKKIKILTHLRQCWNKIVFMPGTDPGYIRQIVEYTENAEHDDAPDSATTVCRYFQTFSWEPRNR